MSIDGSSRTKRNVLSITVVLEIMTFHLSHEGHIGNYVENVDHDGNGMTILSYMQSCIISPLTASK